MLIYDIFSKRQKRLRGEVPDVYKYDTIPRELREQVIHIWRDTLGEPGDDYFNSKYPGPTRAYKYIHDVLSREYGERRLSGPYDSDFESVGNFFIGTDETEKAIDVIEISFECIDEYFRDNPHMFNSSTSPNESITELNHRFQEHGVGYRYESGQIIRVDSEFIHSEVVKPTLGMLSNTMYKGANNEFLNAHKHYRHGRYKECLNDCLNAFESCMKAICRQRRWDYSNRVTAHSLIDTVFKQGLIETFMQHHFTGLRQTLEAGVPTLRNNLSGHGQGPEEIDVPEYIAAYALHLTASNILLLAKANEEMK